MDLKEIKRIASFAKRNGIKRISVNGLDLEFNELVVFPKRARQNISAVPNERDPNRPAPLPEPTLEEINQYIYGNVDEVG
jgi:hypothetical protein